MKAILTTSALLTAAALRGARHDKRQGPVRELRAAQAKLRTTVKHM
jgi:hypothetical protein